MTNLAFIYSQNAFPAHSFLSLLVDHTRHKAGIVCRRHRYITTIIIILTIFTIIIKQDLKHHLPRHCPVATRVRRGNTLDGRENSIGEEDEDGEEDEGGLDDEGGLEDENEEVKSNGKGVRGVSDEKGVDILKKRAPSHNISKSCSPPRFLFSHFFLLICKYFSSGAKFHISIYFPGKAAQRT